MNRPAALLAFALALILGPVRAAAAEPIVGRPCEGCEAIFDGMPAAPGWDVRLAPSGLAGAPLILDGTVRDRRGRAVPGVVVYAYQANADGTYPSDDRAGRGAARRHGTLRAWARTDARGRYRFTTIRPGGYPDADEPQHIHLHVLEPGRCTYFISDVVFTDDPRLTSLRKMRMLASRGGRGIVTPARDAAGRWRARRDIQLGQGIPGYQECGRGNP